ncbi:DinB family protein [Glutamicibacter sp. AOP38-B1-38]|uniref:DinB family protein n=1 Tax=Glutamicibacter sp. AOP38-B1-38 TaxID=3457680 RepID=UPI00403417DF
MTNPDAPIHYRQDPAELVDVFIGQHRQMLLGYLDGLTESEARTHLVASKTTLLGLLKHAVFVERVWFGEAATGASRAELGIPQSPDESFDLAPGDTIASASRAYRQAVARSRQIRQGLADDAVLSGNRRGPLSLAWIQLHLLRELAQHCGHAEILREQLLGARTESCRSLVKAARPTP